MQQTFLRLCCPNFGDNILLTSWMLVAQIVWQAFGWCLDSYFYSTFMANNGKFMRLKSLRQWIIGWLGLSTQSGLMPTMNVEREAC
jgi:hypothetical protein